MSVEAERGSQLVMLWIRVLARVGKQGQPSYISIAQFSGTK